MNKILFSLSILACSLAMTAQQKINLTINYDKATTLNQEVFGVNNELTSRKYYPSNAAFIDVYNELGQPTFRYPAGTASNYLSLTTGFNVIWPNGTPRNKERYKRVGQSLKRAGKTQHGEDYREYVEFLKKTGAKSNFILNLGGVSVADHRKVLLDIKKRGATIDYFELSNEVFFSEYKIPFPSVNDYITKAKAATRMVREIFPQAKVAVAIPAEYYTHETFLDGPNEHGNRLGLWYTGLKNDQFYDALAVHLYSSTGMNNKTKKADFKTYEDAYANCISHVDNRIHDTYKRLKEDFPTKDVWVTEYHVGGFGGELRQYDLRMTYLGGLFTANFMFRLFQNPQVALSSWHSMQQFVVAGGTAGTLLPDDAEFKTMVNYEFLKMFKEPVRNSTQYVPISVDGALQYEGLGIYTGQFDEINAGMFFNPETDMAYVMLFNKKEHAHTLDTKQLEKQLGGQVQDTKILAPYSKMKQSKALGSKTKFTLSETKQLEKDVLELKPYSMSVVKIKIQ